MTVLRIVLTVIFGWSLKKTLELLIRDSSADLFVLDHVGLAGLFVPILASLAAFQSLALLYLWRPSTLLYRAAQASVILNWMETALVTASGLSRPGLLRDAFVASRKGRGLPVREEILPLMDKAYVHLGFLAFAAAVAALWLLLLRLLERRRKVGDSLPT